ncbi:UDP-glycosyltransferase 72B1 [Citrus sinensis]|uniref:UDP-glycosyltransferase 72B1 n=1 Tax=Citrus sinensis TaxID=2711 RepID=A0ACB8JNL0_CITSI|nr:UDP-glycosyltransferase 72B1 [Citrus sinensis]
METQNSKQIPRAYVAMVPTPGIGHLIPLVELAKRLVHQYNFLVTIFVPTIDDGTGSSIQTIRQVLESLPTSISTIFLPPVSFDDLPDDFLIETRITLTLVRSLSSLRDALKVLAESTRLVALVVDPFGSAAFDVANEVGVPAYVFFTTTAMALSFLFHLPELDVKFSCEYRDMPEPVQLPGCVPVHGRDFADGFQQRKNEAYRFLLSFSKQYLLAAGIMVNSFMELETGPFKALMEGESSFKPPPVYPVGPLIQTGSNNETNNDRSLECLKWLDEQPSESVLFVCFGSGGTLSQEQLNELALGLEMSGQRFLWIAKSPHEEAANATYFSVQSMKDPLDFLPKGFLDRTKGVGLVVPSWAPQAQVLSHGSTGGFLSHCGWNSILESIVHGVPIIAWPLYSEQKMNAVLLTDDLKVSFRVKVNENGLVGREDIANYAKGLIQGEEGKLLRKKMRALKDAAANALSPDGSSTKSLAQLARIWKNPEFETK